MNNVIFSVLFFLVVYWGYRRRSVQLFLIKENADLSELFYNVFGSELHARYFWPYFMGILRCSFLSYREVMEEAGIEKDDKVLLIGAGSIPYHIQWKDAVNPENITVFDIDSSITRRSLQAELCIERCRGIFGRRRQISRHVCADADSIPFASGSFDVVVALRSYYVNTDEALRVLKPGGKFVAKLCGEVTSTEKTITELKINGGSIITLGGREICGISD